MMKARLGVGLLGAAAALALVVCGTAVSGGAASDPRVALNEGNRLFGAGQFEAAVAAYFEGYSPREPNPTLFYNLGTALHHQGRLAEAILWYRRAGASGDPWLEENLQLARRSLGSQLMPVGGVHGWSGRHSQSLRGAAIVLAWITLIAVAMDRKLPVWTFVGATTLAACLYGTATAIESWGPQPAVILEDCFDPAGDLPAGTEVWVRRSRSGAWRISGTDDMICPPQAAALVLSDQ